MSKIVLGKISLTASLMIATVTVSAHGAAAQAGHSTVPVAVTGRAPGNIVAAQILAVPDMDGSAAGDSFLPIAIPNVVSHLDGRNYSIAVPPSSVPANFFRDGGLVDFEVQLTGQDTYWTSDTSVRLVQTDQDPAGVWADPVDTAHLAATQEASGRLGTVGLRGAHALVAVAMATEIEDSGTVVNLFGESDQAVIGCRWLNNGGTTDQRSTTIGTTYPQGQSTAAMEIGTSEGASYGIGLNGNSGVGSFKAAGSHFTQDDWGKVWNQFGEARSYRKWIAYIHQFEICDGIDSGRVRWYPTGETGGTGHNDDVTRPDWDQKWCTPVDSGNWYRSSSSGNKYEYGAAVKFADRIGVDLAISRNYSSSQKLHYHIVADSHRLCGNNAFPANAGKVQERYAA